MTASNRRYRIGIIAGCWGMSRNRTLEHISSLENVGAPRICSIMDGMTAIGLALRYCGEEIKEKIMEDLMAMRLINAVPPTSDNVIYS